jgi:type VI secretion system protein ImpB
MPLPEESLQHKLDRVRRPRVQITYDVEIGDAQKLVELPFVMGVLADLSGTPDPDKPLPLLKDEKRKFVNIDRDNFDKVMKGIAPKLEMRVANKLQDDDSKLGVALKFNNILDFEPANVINQVEPLRKLLEVRQKLDDLKRKIVTNDKLDLVLQDIIHNTEKVKELAAQTGRAVPGDEGKAAPATGEA